ncbi:hypothetical protein FOL46_007191 [Perkinsus olseni]|uniref:Uncharacterized protein n=1 Tax=Perkinsus olseni TaxID=32597 RepID=A0A7J6MWZ2_PEROL|nr:hypothetical protein FOL46_007191 [Perkinsus olseni]
MEARERMFGVYLIDDDADSLAHAEVEKLSGHTHHFKEQLFAGMVPIASRIPPVVSDWIPQAHFDTMGAIPYDVVEPGSAAASYFFATSTRRSLVEMFDFEYPTSCLKRGQFDKYCLSVVANKSVSKEQFELDTEIRMADVHDRSRRAEFSLAAVLGSKPHIELALDFSLKARGCAVVWQAGIKISLTVTVCLAADASGHDLFDSATRSFQGSVAASVIFNIKISQINLPVGVRVDGVVACAAYPSNNITAMGKLGITVSIPHGGATMAFDLTATTTHHLPNNWEFASDFLYGMQASRRHEVNSSYATLGRTLLSM